MEENQKHIEDIFKEAFANHEMEVSSNVWAGVQSSLATQLAAAGTASASSTFLSQAAAVVGITSVVALGTVNEVKHFNQDEVAKVERNVELNEPAADHHESTAEYTVSETEVLEAPASAEHVAPNDSEIHIEKPRKVEQEVEPDNTTENQSGTIASTGNNPKPKVSEKQGGVGNEEPVPNQENPQQKESEADKVAQSKESTPPAPVEPEEEEMQCIAYFPHAAQEWVTPNGDNNNDYFSVNGATDVSEFHIRIWTRSKQLVFESSDPNFTWYGTDLRGEPLPNRTMCYYQIDALDVNGVHYSGRNAKGSIMVITQ